MDNMLVLSKILLMPAEWTHTARLEKWRRGQNALPLCVINSLLLQENHFDIDPASLTEQNWFFITRWERFYPAAMMTAARQLAPVFLRFPASLSLLNAEQRAFLYVPWFPSTQTITDNQQPDFNTLEQQAYTSLMKAMHNRLPEPLIPLLAFLFPEHCKKPQFNADQTYPEDYSLFLQAIEYA
ncbi:hypothetical protein [Citrobacter sp. U14242]|uniref:hypothetical protein n=1 Tax=Citrobacter sp. U14242 TaxID=3390192 RepID=UPI00397CC321